MVYDVRDVHLGNAAKPRVNDAVPNYD